MATPLLSSIGDKERSALLRVAARRRFGRGEVVFHEGDPGDSLHVVTAGVFVASSLSTRGEMIAVNLFDEGTVFGELSLLTESSRRSATVVAWRRGATMMITRSDFDGLRFDHPAIDRFLVTVLAERNRALNDHLVELLFSPADKRVYRRLLAFAAVVSAEHEGGWVSLSQSQLATLAGTTRPTVNRALRRAERIGLVRLARGRIRLVDVAGLERQAS